MDWVKLAVRYYADHAIEALPDADTEMMFVRGLARAGELGRSGFIPETSLPSLTRKRRYTAAINALIRSGLWTKVDGGYQITAWSDWQDGMDALAKRRADDRARKRKHRDRESTESRDWSRDMSRDVTPLEGEGEGEGDKDLGYLRREGYVSERDSPPPRTCPKHRDDDDPPPCGKCKDFRLIAERWERERVEDEQRQRNALRLCKLCNLDGFVLIPGRGIPVDPPQRCNHIRSVS